MYEDDYGTLLLHDVGGEGKMLILHAEVIPTSNRKILAHYTAVLDQLCLHLKQRGMERLKVWVQTDEQIRYAAFFGFGPEIKEVRIEGAGGLQPDIFEMEREL